MVHYTKVINGLAVFIDREIVAKMQGKMQGWVLGGIAGLALAKTENIYRNIESNPMVKALGIIDGDNVDIDTLYEQFRKQAQRGSATLELPFIGGVTFNAADVENLYRYIKEA